MSCSNIYMNELEELFYNSYTSSDIGRNDIIMPTKYGIGSYLHEIISFGQLDHFTRTLRRK